MKFIHSEEIKRITQYIDLQAQPEQADIAFIFGTTAENPVQIASDLFLNGIVKYIVVTGGMSRKSKKIEAETHKEILLARGIPRDRIIIENQSTNTLENVVFAWEVIRNLHSELLPIRSVVAIAKWYHSRRAVMTLKRNLPPGIRYYASTYTVHGFNQNDWWENEVSINYVLKEWNSIPKYLKQGYLSEIIKEQDAYI